MNLNLSHRDWLSLVLAALFLYRGIQDLRNGTGTGWGSEDERRNFHKFSGVTLILCGVFYLVNIFLPNVEPLHSILMVAALLCAFGLMISNLCYNLSRDDQDKKK